MAPTSESISVITAPSLDGLPQDRREQVEKLTERLNLDAETCQRIRKTFESEMDIGLDIHSEVKSSLQMANTFVPQLPDGTEDGEYLALDLGGTNFRVMLLRLSNGRQADEIVKFYDVPDDLRLGPATDLFDHLADCLHSFCSDHDRLNQKMLMGFTFSFPMHQKSLNCGILVAWTKSYNCPGAVGEDAVRMLNEAIRRRGGGLDIQVIAILNDTTGTLVQGAYIDKSTGIGVILGTGSNACYIEKAERVQAWEGAKPEGVSEVIIDIEYGAFGDNGVLDFIKTEYDVQVDNNSLLVNSFTFEKYIAGKYLGELVRVILMKLQREELLCIGKSAVKLDKTDCFSTKWVSMIEEDSVKGGSTNTAAILDELGLDYTAEDVAIVKYVAFLASVRAAKLVSVCLAYLLDRMDRSNLVTIAVDGSVFQFHPRFRLVMEHYISEFAPTRKFALIMAEDGSGKGAGMVVAIAKKLAVNKV